MAWSLHCRGAGYPFRKTVHRSQKAAVLCDKRAAASSSRAICCQTRRDPALRAAENPLGLDVCGQFGRVLAIRADEIHPLMPSRLPPPHRPPPFLPISALPSIGNHGLVAAAPPPPRRCRRRRPPGHPYVTVGPKTPQPRRRRRPSRRRRGKGRRRRGTGCRSGGSAAAVVLAAAAAARAAAATAARAAAVAAPPPPLPLRTGIWGSTMLSTHLPPPHPPRNINTVACAKGSSRCTPGQAGPAESGSNIQQDKWKDISG